MQVEPEIAAVADATRGPSSARVPNRFHVIGGLDPRSRAFPLADYLGLESCLDVHRPEAVYYYFRREPAGYYWERIRDRIIPIELSPAPPSSYTAEVCPGTSPADFAVRTDLIGLAAIVDQGGILADAGTLFIRRFPDHLLGERAVLGEVGRDEEAASSTTLAPRPLGDALIMAERGSAFIRTWLAALGREAMPGAAVPDRLRREHPDLLHVEPPASFFKYPPTARGIGRLMRGCSEDLSDVLALQPWGHLWSPGTDPGSSGFAHGLLTEAFVRDCASTYCLAARRYLPGPRSRSWRFAVALARAGRSSRKCAARLRQAAFGGKELGKVAILGLLSKRLFPDDPEFHLAYHRRLWRHRGFISRFAVRTILEETVIRCVAFEDEYGMEGVRFAPDDVVIDIGAHVGAFGYLAYLSGSRNVYCFEPEAGNFRRLARSLAGLPGIRPYNLAVFRSDIPPDYRLAHSGYHGDNTGNGNVILGGRFFDSDHRGVEAWKIDASSWAGFRAWKVEAESRPRSREPEGTAAPAVPHLARSQADVVPLDEILARFPRVRLMKLDCEGSEFPILLTSRLLHKVDCIVGEYHELDEEMASQLDGRARLDGPHSYRIPALAAALESLGFRFELARDAGASHMGLFRAVRPNRPGDDSPPFPTWDR